MESLDERIKRLESELEEIKNERLKEKESKFHQPCDDEVVFYIDNVKNCLHIFQVDYKFCKFQFSTGWAFRTKEEAEAQVERLKCLSEYLNLIAKYNEGWVPDFSNEHEAKLFHIYNMKEKLLEFRFMYVSRFKSDRYIAKSEEILKRIEFELGTDKIIKALEA